MVVVAGGIVCIFIWMTWTMACVALWIASYGEWHGGGGDGGRCLGYHCGDSSYCDCSISCLQRSYSILWSATAI